MEETKLRQELEDIIRSTLVIENKTSIHFAVDKIIQKITNGNNQPIKEN
jgi:hypothetical protein